MKSINYVIVELDKPYLNEVELSNGSSFIVNSTIENVDYINRVATVIESPDFTILKKGDKVVAHHNIFRLRNGMKGERLQSNYHIEGNKYFIPLLEVFMYDSGNGWEAIDPYCFVKPIKQEQGNGFQLSLKETSYKGRVPQHGIMWFPNKSLKEQGVERGDKVFFSKYSEYEFNIDGELYYKMKTTDILLKK